ncbi:DNA polymerase III subunit delta [Neisseria sp. Ec49-e6-T10]|uniref:DNA polymerase III subunit delta n=1 Tax=Neisseria sp. Ec49-e6-T10 TaxID=3140744 RepID=UPI003EC12B0C
MANQIIQGVLAKNIEPLQSLYLIHGEEELLNLETIDVLRAAAKQQGFFERENHVVDNHFSWRDLLDSMASMSLFSDKKLLEVHIPTGKPGNEGSEALQQLANAIPEDTTIVIVLPKLERTQLQSKWFIALSKQGVVVENKAVTKEALPNWLKIRLNHHKLSIAEDALTLFSERVEGNLLAAKQEIDKLTLLFPEGSTLTLEDIQYSIAQVARFDVFQLAEAWMSADLNRVNLLIAGLEQDADAPVLLLWALTEDIRALLKLRAGMAQGKNINTLAPVLRLWGAKKTLAPLALKRIGTKKLLSALQLCAKIDRQIKGAQAGNAWEEVKNVLFMLSSEYRLNQ